MRLYSILIVFPLSILRSFIRLLFGILKFPPVIGLIIGIAIAMPLHEFERIGGSVATRIIYCGLIMGFIWFAVGRWRQGNAEWQEIDSLAEYLIKNPECKTGQGIQCCHCGSRSIKNWGRMSSDDMDRKHICNSCGETLYRTRTN
jgi:hypothetical protein